MRIALAQIDTTVGDLAGNAARVRAAAARAAAAGCSLVACPELALPGYPPRDFLDVPEFVERQVRALEDLARAPELAACPALVGFAEPHPGAGAGLYNACALAGGGAVRAIGRKTLLPTYDVFDEARYFDPAPAVTVADAGGPVGLSICEDIWNDKRFWTRRRYERDPVAELAAGGARLVVNVSASPYARGKPELRERMLGAAARNHGLPVAYVNLVGGNDSLVFDGHSAVFDARGEVVARARGFAEELLVWDSEAARVPCAEPAGDLDQLLEALVLGTRDYARKTGFCAAVLGLSGGIDSSLTAVIAARALGPENVLGVAMPSRYTLDMSTEDARALAAALGIGFEVLPIEPMFRAFLAALAPVFGDRPADTTEENLQARVRGTLLMALSNKFGRLVLSTGNKSELAVGYCTLYGDMAGGLAVIGDLPKTDVYALARHLNAEREIIPRRVIERPPTAELRPDQTDQDSLPPYDRLDRVLEAYVGEHLGPDALERQGFDRRLVERVLGLVLASEYKRRQAAPALRVTRRAFGEGWRFPIAHGFRY